MREIQTLKFGGDLEEWVLKAMELTGSRSIPVKIIEFILIP
jgi:hypothetical protein